MADAPPVDVPILPPVEALEFFRAKGFAIGFAWQDVWQAEHARAFTVAKAMTRDLLEDIRAAVDAAIAEGQTLKQFSDGLRPTLVAKGWWGKKRMIDPLTMEAKKVQLGSPRRLKTIFDVNMRVAYETGKWERIRRTAKAFPFLRYVSVMDGRERPQHHAWHGTILPIDHEWWETHTPPCGWNCRCTVASYNQRQLDRRGLSLTEKPVAFPKRPWVNKRTGEVTQLEDGIDAGWSYHIGKAPLEGLAPRPLPPGVATETAAVRGRAKSKSVPATLAAFLGAFALERDGVFTDRAGWPLAISAGWLANLSRADQELAAQAARAIADPDSIRLLWVHDEAGKVSLMRRFAGHGWLVDVGGIGWRWRRASDPGRGFLAWAKVATETANREYRRDSKGRFASTGGMGAAVASLWDAKGHTTVTVGSVDRRTAVVIKAKTGIDAVGWPRVVDAQHIQHIRNYHGDKSKHAGKTTETTRESFGKVAKIIAGVQPSVRMRRGSAPTIAHEMKVDGQTWRVVHEVRVRKKTLALKSLFVVDGG